MEREFKLTAFEADGAFFEFTYLPFGVSNAIPNFQHAMNDFISKYGLEGTIAYLDDFLILGKTKEEHDNRLPKYYY